MLDKVIADPDAAVADMQDGATLVVAGFGLSGHPATLLDAVLRKGVKDLTVVSNNAGTADVGLGGLVLHGRVRHLICSFPTGKGMWAIKERIEQGRIRVTVVPQGTLAERCRAGGAGLGGFLTPTGLDTELTRDRRIVELEGRRWVLEPAIRTDYAFVHARRGDRWGNLCYRLAARNFNPSMAMAGRITLAEVEELVELGEMDPNHIHTPGIFVQRVVPLNGRRSTGGKG